MYRTVLQTAHEFADLQLVRAHAIKGRQNAMKDVVHPFKTLCPFHSRYILRFFNDTDEPMVPLFILTNFAPCTFTKIKTGRTEMDLILDSNQRRCQSFHIASFHIKGRGRKDAAPIWSQSPAICAAAHEAGPEV